MFTVKCFHRAADSHHGYLAERYTVDEAAGEVRFKQPGLAGPDTCVCLGRIYERIVVENPAGRTVANIAWLPGVPEAEFRDAAAA